ncbi:MAG: mechanosensitive ion channel family protein [Acetobacteraceae bacterium]
MCTSPGRDFLRPGWNGIDRGGVGSLAGAMKRRARPRAGRVWCWIALLAALAPGVPAGTARAAAPAAAVTAAPALAPGTLSPDQITRLLALLRDPAARAQFEATLEALAKASPAPAPAARPAATAATKPAATKPAATKTGTATTGTAKTGTTKTGTAKTGTAKPAATKPAASLHIPLAPNSLAAMLLSDVSQRIRRLTREMVTTAQAVTRYQLLWFWITATVQDPGLRKLLLDAAWKLLLVMAAGTALEWLARRGLGRARSGLSEIAEGVGRSRDAEAEAAPARLRGLPSLGLLLWRVPFVLGRLFLDLLPVAAFWLLATFLLADVLGSTGLAQLVVLAVVDAYVAVRVVMSATRMIVSPDTPALRLVHVSDATALYLVRWVRRIAAVIAFGFGGIEVGVLFGLYPAARIALVKLVMLVVHVFAVIIVLQRRREVAAWIRGQHPPKGLLGRGRVWLARVWHIVAIFYVVALWVVWAIGLPNGFGLLLRVFLVSVAVLVGARLLTVALRDALDRWILEAPALAEGYPLLHERLRHYHPALRATVSAVVAAAAALLLLEAWGFGTLSWLTQGALGRRVSGAVGTIGLTLLFALLAWEGVNTGIQRHLTRLAAGAKAARAARLRTLLPMLRSALFVVIAIVVGLITLSEIGVNIAPLLAGAGVVGLAIGFGSQKLVQDIITGLFLLLEDAMQVGDVVALGGLSGVVENLSVRTIRLRAADGSVHVIPFSAVTTVTNQTRDFGYAVLNLQVGYKEDVDRVIALLTEIVHKMRDEPLWEDMIKDELEVWGLDQFGASGLVIACRIKTGPAQRWAVGREFNRRIKLRFEQEGIEIPYPYQRLSIDPAEWREALAPAAQSAMQGAPPIAAPDAGGGMAAMRRGAAD